MQKNQELQKLIDEQERDMDSAILFPENITKMQYKPLLKLPEKERASVILSVIGNMSNAEIGVAMRTSESTIRGYLKRAYEKLRRKDEQDRGE